MRCQFCYNTAPRFSPKLISSGKSRPKDLKCPYCDRLYDSGTNKCYVVDKKVIQKNLNRVPYY